MRVENGKMIFSKEDLAGAWKVLTDPDVWLREDFKAAIQDANTELMALRAYTVAHPPPTHDHLYADGEGETHACHCKACAALAGGEKYKG